MTDNVESVFQETQVSTPVQKNWRDVNIHNYIKIFTIGALFYYLFQNEILGIIRRWSDPSWSHGFLIPLFSLYFINQRKNEILSLRRTEDPLRSLIKGRWPKTLQAGEIRPNYLGLIFLIIGIAFYPFNVVHLQYGYLKPIGMIATIGAVVLFLGGWSLIKYTWLPIVFLVFAVPLPQRYYVAFTMPMRKLAATVASVLLNLVNGLDATVSGVIIDVVYKGQRLEPALNVAEACSGMRLLMAFLALGVAMAYLHYRPIWQRIILLACTVPIAILCNIARVTITGFIYVFIHPKYAQGIYHDLLGMAMLPLAFCLYGLLAKFMASLFIDETEQTPVQNVIIRKRNTD